MASDNEITRTRTDRQNIMTRVSYWMVFRLIFILFFLHLMGEVFYRWDGFSYYASFSEFLPSVALITILWSIVAVFTAVLVWLLLIGLEWFCRRLGLEVRKEHFLLFMCFFVLLGTMALIGKRFILAEGQTTLQLQLKVFLYVTLAVTFLTWLFRNKAEQWIGVIQERITPLVWLFGIWVILSVPLVAYHTWGKQTDNVISQKISQSSLTDRNRPNIILVIFDTLTARDMSVYGYERLTTPFISEWAKSASLFTRLEAESNFTGPTTASLMTGKRLWTHQTYHGKGSKPEKSNIENLPLVLKNNGYYNMAFVVNPAATVKVLGIADSFDIAPISTEFRTPTSLIAIIINKSLHRLFIDKIRLHDWIVKKHFIFGKLIRALIRDSSKTPVPPEKAFNRFLSVLDDNPPEPFFAWIHLFPPHFSYLPPPPYIGMFDPSSELTTAKTQAQAQARAKVRSGTRDKDFSQEVQPIVNTLRARYDEFIRYSDKQFEEFIVQLAKRDILKNTVIIFSSDHGESFEHNSLGHGKKHLYEQVTHIPLIIKGPDQTEGQIINDLIEQIDIPPTILDLAGIPVPSWMEGRSLAPLMQGKRLPSKPLFSMNFRKNRSLGHQITKGTIAVWEGDYKLIYYLKKKKSLLFNLKQDPDELNNLFDREPEVGQRLLSLIQDNLKKANERISSGE